MRLRSVLKRLTLCLVGIVAPAQWLWPQSASAQVQVTPNFSITPSKTITPWVFQMAIGAVIIGVLILLAILASYMRYGPKFFGRGERPAKAPPGVRPPRMDRQAARPPLAARPAPSAPAARPAPAQASAATATATAVAERPAPTAEREAEPAVAASTETTEGPSAEAAAQADAVGQAEIAAPEAVLTAKAEEEVGAAEPAVAEEPKAEQPAAEEPAPQQAAAHGPGAMDQETFDRVLAEQLEKGVDRRVAEGRARAAAVVAARKKAQG
jgi:hypothetical protein